MCKITDEQIQYDGYVTKVPLSVRTVYERIKRSNSSLNRKSKKLLEDSIERVIAVVKENELDEDGNDGVSGSDGSGSDGVRRSTHDSAIEVGIKSILCGEPNADTKPQSTNSMNDNIVGLWSTPRSTPSRSNGISLTAPDSTAARTTIAAGPGARDTSVHASIAVPSSRVHSRRPDEEPPAKRRKDGKGPRTVDRAPPTHTTLADLGGVDAVVHELTELIALPILFPVLYNRSGIQPPRGVLLHGPPGCGKTMIANAFAAELGVSYIPISAPSIVSGMSGESEKKLRDYFDEARRMAPCLVFIDEIDSITPKRESAQREMEKRIVAQMLTCMDDLTLEKTDGKPVIIIAATNRPDSLDPALRRAGRFNKEINLSVPDEGGRESILHALTRHLTLAGPIDFRSLAKMTPGYVGADLNDLVSTAGVAATRRIFDALTKGLVGIEAGEVPSGVRLLRDLVARSTQAPSLADTATMAITHEDFVAALPKVQPSSKREGFATIPNTTWNDIGALHSVREELQMAIVEPIRRPDRYARVGIVAPTGVLLWGPPGCGKTLLAKAVANQSQANFISVKGPELLNKVFIPFPILFALDLSQF